MRALQKNGEEESRNRECRTKGKEESAPEVFKDFEIFCKKSYERIYEWIGNSGRQKRLKADCRRARKKKAEEWRKKIKEKMAEDERKKILRKKKGVGHPELFAIMEDSGRWIEGEELEKTVAKQLRNFGFQKKCEEGWGEDREKMCKITWRAFMKLNFKIPQDSFYQVELFQNLSFCSD